MAEVQLASLGFAGYPLFGFRELVALTGIEPVERRLDHPQYTASDFFSIWADTALMAFRLAVIPACQRGASAIAVSYDWR